MGGHIIRSLQGVSIFCSVFRHQTFEEVGQVERDVGVGVLLNYQRGRSVLNKYRQ